MGIWKGSTALVAQSMVVGLMWAAGMVVFFLLIGWLIVALLT